MNQLERVRRNYRAAFLGYLTNRDETALHAAYQIGRSAVADGLSLLDLAQVHHEILIEVVRAEAEAAPDPLIGAASDFLVEVLATYQMTQRTPQPSVESGRQPPR